MRALRANNVHVAAISPHASQVAELAQAGIQGIDFAFNRSSKNVLADVISAFKLAKIFRMHSFSVVHTFTIKPNIFASMAARLAGVSHIINSVTGLGSMYIASDQKPGLKKRIFEKLLNLLYRLGVMKSDVVIFQNDDDLQFFLDREIVKKEKTHLIQGSGVDTDRYAPIDPVEKKLRREKFGLPESATVVCCISRLLRDKGIAELLNAMRSLQSTHEHIMLLMVGAFDEANPTAISRTDFLRMISGNNILFWENRRDVKEFLPCVDIFCLPSYREGTPGAVLESMACGLPVVTTDAPGCRQLIEVGKNGLLAQVADVPSLLEALTYMCDHSDIRQEMGRNGRQKVLKELSNQVVVNAHLQLYDSLS